jgi:hypothetical protein
MTNTINSVTLAIVWLVAVTNWTGHRVGTNELGYVATNHVLKCEYQGQSYDFTLKSEPGVVMVWRTSETELNRQWSSNLFWGPFTNLWFPNSNSTVYITNQNVTNITNRYTLEATNWQGQP